MAFLTLFRPSIYTLQLDDAIKGIAHQFPVFTHIMDKDNKSLIQ